MAGRVCATAVAFQKRWPLCTAIPNRPHNQAQPSPATKPIPAHPRNQSQPTCASRAPSDLSSRPLAAHHTQSWGSVSAPTQPGSSAAGWAQRTPAAAAAVAAALPPPAPPQSAGCGQARRAARPAALLALALGAGCWVAAAALGACAGFGSQRACPTRSGLQADRGDVGLRHHRITATGRWALLPAGTQVPCDSSQRKVAKKDAKSLAAR